MEDLDRGGPNRIKETRLLSILEKIKEIRARKIKEIRNKKAKELRMIRTRESKANRNPGGIGGHLSPSKPGPQAPLTSKEARYSHQFSHWPLPNRVTSLTSHCCGKKMIVDLDRATPLDDIRSNCKCKTAPALRILTLYCINNKNRAEETKDAPTSTTVLKTTQGQQHQKKPNPSTPIQV